MAQDNVMAGQTPRPGRVSRMFGRYIVKGRFQTKFSVMVFAFLSFSSFWIWLLGRWTVDRMVKSELITDAVAIEQLAIFNMNIAYIAILMLAVTVLLSLIFSHFIAGPVYRFERTLEQMRDGNLAVHVRLRKRDEFKEVADLFNQALASLRNRVRKDRDLVRDRLDKIAGVAGQLRASGKTAEADELDRLVNDVKAAPTNVAIE